MAIIIARYMLWLLNVCHFFLLSFHIHDWHPTILGHFVKCRKFNLCQSNRWLTNLHTLHALFHTLNVLCCHFKFLSHFLNLICGNLILLRKNIDSISNNTLYFCYWTKSVEWDMCNEYWRWRKENYIASLHW